MPQNLTLPPKWPRSGVTFHSVNQLNAQIKLTEMWKNFNVSKQSCAAILGQHNSL